MLDDTSGRVAEAMVFYNPCSAVAINAVIEALPETRFYIPYGYTREDLIDIIRTMPLAHDAESYGTVRSFMTLITEYPQFLYFFNSNEQSIKDELRHWKIDMKRGKPVPFPYEDVTAIWKLFRQDQIFREFVYRCISLTNSRNPRLKGSRTDIDALQEQYKGRVEFFPVNDIIGNFSRDMVLATGNGRRTLIQGKPWSKYTLNYSHRTVLGDALVAQHSFWKNHFDLLPSSGVGLIFYEGGDMRAAGDTLFVGQQTWVVNYMAGSTPSHIEDELLRLSGMSNVIVVGKETRPLFPTHLDMYFVPFDDKHVGVGDMTPVVTFLEQQKRLKDIHVKSYKKRQPYLDRTSTELERMGYVVSRIPLYVEFDPEGYDELTVSMHIRSFANEVRNGNESILAPFGIPALDDSGYEIFERHGLTIKEIKSAGSLDTLLSYDPLYAPFCSGGIRCYVNVLERQ